MKKLTGRLLIVLITIMMLGITVSADVTASLDIASGSVTAVQTADTVATDSIGKGYGIVSVDSTDAVVHFDGKEYEELSYNERTKFMTAFLQSIKASGLGAKEKNSIYNFIASQDTEVHQAIKYLTEDTSADLATARLWLAPFTGGLGTVIGVLVLIIFIFLGVGILWDVAYLALPPLQLVLERGDDTKKPFGVSAEAWKANREVALDYKNTKNEIGEYLKRRVPVIIVCAICIGYLISGKVYEILTYVANAFG